MFVDHIPSDAVPEISESRPSHTTVAASFTVCQTFIQTVLIWLDIEVILTFIVRFSLPLIASVAFTIAGIPVSFLVWFVIVMNIEINWKRGVVSFVALKLSSKGTILT